MRNPFEHLCENLQFFQLHFFYQRIENHINCRIIKTLTNQKHCVFTKTKLPLWVLKISSPKIYETEFARTISTFIFRPDRPTRKSPFLYFNSPILSPLFCVWEEGTTETHAGRWCFFFHTANHEHARWSISFSTVCSVTFLVVFFRPLAKRVGAESTRPVSTRTGGFWALPG